MNAAQDSKLSPPERRAGLLPRPALAAHFTRLAECRLLLVCAPAGYGKTSALLLVHEQLRAAGRRVAWLTLDERDRDLQRFADCLLLALRRAGAAAGQGPSRLLGAAVALPPEVMRTTLLNELALLGEEVVVLLDDYHLVDAEDIRALVNAALLSPLLRLRFVIASRTPNGLPLGRLRALAQVEEVEVTDLAFSEAEVETFVTGICGRALSAPQVSRLRQATEGWAASLQLAGIALRDGADIDRFLDRFSGEHRSVSEFLGEEVFRRQPAELQDFLRQTSILRRFNAGLCEAVTGTRRGRALLDELERRNLFLFALDAERRWFRYHPLFGDFLRRRWREDDAARCIEGHRRASRWLEGQGLALEAIEHAFEAGDVERAGRLLDRASADLFAAGQTATLFALAARLPAALLERLPRLQLERAWHSELSWRFDEAREALARVERALATPPVAEDDERADHALLKSKLDHRRMMLKLLSDDARGTVRAANEWLTTDTTHDAFMRASAGTALMAAHRVLFRCEGAQTSARMLRARYIEGGALYGIVFHQCVVGATLFERGELEAAHEAYETALQTAVELQGEHSALYSMPAVLFAELYYEWDRQDAAEEMLAARDIASSLGFVDNLVAGFVTRVRLHAAAGRVRDAESLIGEGEWFATSHGFARMAAALREERLHLLERTGRAAEALAVLRAVRRADDRSPPAAPREDACMTDFLLALGHARGLRLDGQAREAAALLRAWFVFARERRCARAAIRAGVALCHAQLVLGDRRAASRTLKDSLDLAQPGGFRRSLLDADPSVRELIGEVLRQTPAADEVQQRYLTALVGMSPAPDAAPQGSGAEALSARELEILALGAQGLQNSDVARALFLAQSTVKWYWQRIFDKLQVRRRADAIRLARERNWVR